VGKHVKEPCPCKKGVRTVSDGHTRTWYVCNDCGHTWWIAPWVAGTAMHYAK
jgi:hypothetical protein